MNKFCTVLYLTLIGFIFNVEASEYSDCKEWKDTSTMYEGCMMNHETEEAQKKIEVLQKNILKFKPAARKQFQQSVIAWNNYVQKTCDLQVAVMGGINGISSSRCYSSLTKQRLSYLQGNF
jgi:uncharacterized protein YecT (DUF1311 family)